MDCLVIVLQQNLCSFLHIDAAWRRFSMVKTGCFEGSKCGFEVKSVIFRIQLSVLRCFFWLREVFMC